MDKKISLARQEEERQSMLLSGAGTGTDGERALRGAEGKEKASDSERPQRKAPISHASARESSPASKSGDGSYRAKHKQSNDARRAIREAKARNRAFGRSAKELGIEWLNARCEDSPVSKAHFLVTNTIVDEGTMFECIYCHKVKWLPNSMNGCIALNKYLQVYGLDGGYQRMLDDHPAAKRMLAKVQDIYYLRKALPDVQFYLALASIVMDREYPYDVNEVEEEEML